MKVIAFIIILGLAGLGIGYGIFGQINGNYVDLESIFSKKTGLVENLVSSAMGYGEMRTRILECGAGGAVLGLVLGVVFVGKQED